MKRKIYTFTALALLSLGAYAVGEFHLIKTVNSGQALPATPQQRAFADESLSVPFTITPTQEQAQNCDLSDRDGKGTTWYFGQTVSLNTAAQDAFCFKGDRSNFGDDWLTLPKINFTEAGLYVLTFDVATRYYKERLEVYMADTNNYDDFFNNKIESYQDFSTSCNWETKTIKISITSPCTKYLSFRVCSTTKGDYLFLRNIKMEKGAAAEPFPPVISAIDFDGGDGTITATMPMKAFDGSYLDKTLTANFSIDGGELRKVEADPGEPAVLNVQGLEKGEHSVSVYASYMDGSTELKSDAVSQTFTIVSAADLRYELPLTLNLGENFNDLTIIDVDDDGYTWTRDGNAIMYTSTSLRDANDWVFTRPVSITADDASHILRLAIDARAGLSLAPESFEIWIGSAASPEAMTRKVISVENINNTDFQTFSEKFALPAAGDYVIGMHAVTEASKGYLYLQNLDFEATNESSGTPGVPTDIFAEPDQTGKLQATIYFTYPSVTASGSPLDADSNVTITATCGRNSAEVTGKQGTKGQLTINTEKGDNTILLTSSNSKGTGLYTSVAVTCGLDLPVAPRILSTLVSEDNYSMTVRWRAVEDGVNEGIVNPDAMRYRIFLLDPETELAEEIDDTDKTTYTYTVSASSPILDTYYIAIEAYNSPESCSPTRSIAHAVLGKPYEAPIEETFKDEKLHYGPVSLFSSQPENYAPQWYIGNPADLNSSAACPDSYALIGHTAFASGDTQIELPKFSTLLSPSAPGMAVTGYDLTFNIYISEYTPSMQFIGLYYGAENAPVEIATLDTSLGSGWVEITYPLPADLLDKQWVAVRNQVNFSRGSSDWALIDGYSVVKNEITGVEEVSEGARSITGGRGVITLRGYEGTRADIFTLDGRRLGTLAITSQQYSVVLAPGIYIVRTPDASGKLIVK